MNLSWHNIDQVFVSSRLTYFYRSYYPLLKFSFPDFSLSSFEIMTWNLVYEFVLNRSSSHLLRFYRSYGPLRKLSFPDFSLSSFEIMTWNLVYEFVLNRHTCEPPDGRINSPVSLGRLPISNILPNSPDFYMFMSQMCSLHHVHLGQRSKMQLELIEQHSYGLLNPLHSAEVVDSHFEVCFNNFIYPSRVDYFTLGWSLFEYLLGFNSKFQNIYF